MTSLEQIISDHRRQLIKAERSTPSTRGGTSAEAEIVSAQLEGVEFDEDCECGHSQIYHEDGFDKDDARHNDGACNHMECGCREYKLEREGGPCPNCEYEEGRSLADRLYHEENCSDYFCEGCGKMGVEVGEIKTYMDKNVCRGCQEDLIRGEF